MYPRCADTAPTLAPPSVTLTMTSGVLLTVRAICSIWARLKWPDVCGPARPALKISKRDGPPDGSLTGRLVKRALPAHECRPCQIVCALLQGRDQCASSAEVLLKIRVHETSLSHLPNGPCQEPSEACEDGHSELKGPKLISGQRRVCGHVSAHQRSEVGRVLHSALRRPLADTLPITRPQPNRDPINGRLMDRRRHR